MIIGLLVVLFLLVISNISADFICDIVGILYPGYMSFKAIETKDPDDDKQWLTYWTVFAVYKMIDFTATVLFFWVPYYYPLKFLVLVWLIYPEAKGASVIYDEHLKHHMETYSKKIDELVA